ncbi:flagellar biosynthesis protein FlhF [Pararobbsia alpina]|uniref:Flagellar biosynthesis protein FlhF n=1 Tax=Pararobbsia alpina TaxID=621374 RepID=A0A6S7AUL6_9BURK|nr:flagellar biosynthesis protein FlhF [Pararobbsia alpina]CAB3778583.1 Signal recognition particle receptor FtsY [Pararobbsia alpina]
MKIRKFIAGSSREALRLVREALGDDAVVLSNRAIEGGVELVALAEGELASLASPTDDSERRAQRAARREQGLGAGPRSMPAGSASAASGGVPGASGGMKQRGAGAQGGAPGIAAGMPPSVLPAGPAHQQQTASAQQAAAPAAYLSAHSPQGLAAQNAQLSGALFAGENYDTLSATAYTAPGTDPQQSDVFGGAALGRGAPLPGSFDERLSQVVPQQQATSYDGVGYPSGLPDPFAATFGQPAESSAAPAGTVGPAYEEDASTAEDDEHADPLARALAARKALASMNQHVVPLTASEAASKGLGRAVAAREEAVERAPSSFAFEPVQAEDPPFIHRAHSADDATAQASDNTRKDTPEADGQASQLQEAMLERVTTSVLGELHAMRGALEEQLASLQWSDRQRRHPVRNQMAKTLLSTGFSAQFTNLLIDRIPNTLQEHTQALDWAKAAIERNLPVLDDEDAMMERGGVYALMGPTGVGKTTTTAKLAARCVMRFGAERVALLTTDSYRIGAHEQLRIYGKILGVSVHAVKDAADLKLTLDELRNKHIVLIDTIGMSQRDRALTEQVAMLCGTGRPVQRLLLLNATSHGDTLNEVVHAYRSSGGSHSAGGLPDLTGCILTKLDEATNIGAVLDTVIRYRLPVHYVSTGQKVPENLYVARKPFLMKSAFCIPRESSPFTPMDDDFPVVMSGTQARSTAELSEVRFG